MAMLSSEMLHATCVSIAGRGVLIQGESGSGKSDLALRLIDRGALLVSDDYTLTHRTCGALVAQAPATIAGKIEVRGVGIIEVPHIDQVPVSLLVTIGDSVERLPEPQVRQIAGVDIPLVALSALEASAPIKVEMALAQFGLSLT
jgi:serine kinase of HPr protein (carbohydrate metabolism regulator)